MIITKIEEQLDSAQNRLEILQNRATDLSKPAQDLLQEVIDELSNALEELHVTIEELNQQNEELSITRSDIELERQRYQELFELAPDAYVVTNPQGIIQEANSAAYSLFNSSYNLMMGKPLSLFVVPEDCTLFRTQLNQFQTMGQLRDWEIRLKPRRRKPLTASINVSTIYNREKQSIGLRWIIRDINDRKQAEEIIRNQLAVEQELNQLKTRFIRTVSHEYRTPLSTILCSAQILKNIDCKQEQEKKKKNNLERIEISVKRMVRLLEDVLIFAKAEAGKVECKPISINLEQFCRRLLHDYQISEEMQPRIHLTFRGNCDSVYLDPELLERILTNLLSNALKYAPDDSRVDFDVNCEPHQVSFRIQDQGIGIPPEDQARVFETFHRGSNVGVLPGTGLGLAIVKKAVDLHGGAIAIDSTVGVGTTVTVTLRF